MLGVLCNSMATCNQKRNVRQERVEEMEKSMEPGGNGKADRDIDGGLNPRLMGWKIGRFGVPGGGKTSQRARLRY
jgi:hypothetical protein